jgi:cytochrome c peroxidase
MKIKLFIPILLFGSVLLLLSFFGLQDNAPDETIKAYYMDNFRVMSREVSALKTAVTQDKSDREIRAAFLQSRLAFKKVEMFISYYLELQLNKFNGLTVNFIEEEDPDMPQELQGFQMIESFIYPEYNRTKKEELLEYVDKLLALTNGMIINPESFTPDDFVHEASMTELYRVLSLGISGFDSPIAQLSLPEAAASLNSVGAVTAAYKNQFQQASKEEYDRFMQLLQQAASYLNKHNNFVRFDRMVFITQYLNPLCDVLASLKRKAGYTDNPNRHVLIKQDGNPFKEESLLVDRYLFDDNITSARIELGKKLFYEPLLSANGKRSCASCHVPGKAFTDGQTKALQVDEHSVLPRNTPTLWNASLQKNFFYDSRKRKLDDVVMEVLSNDKEMNTGADKAAQKLAGSTTYTAMFVAAYDGNASITDKNITNAIAMYVRTLISYNSRFDQYMRGVTDKMTKAEINGFNLFMGKAKCATCHYVPLFNGSKPPSYYYQESEVIGVPASTDTLHAVLDSDIGRGPIMHLSFFDHAFKTPTLRNIALTAPYMHNGVYKTLEEVVDFYDRGGGLGLHIDIPNQTLPGDRLQLTKTEKKQLVAFMGTLTDTTMVSGQ